jgi:signal transduction histidine kinase
VKEMGENPTKVEEGTLKFRPKARLLYILGHELITDETIAMIELMKNSYDADAQEVHVTLTDVSDKEKGKIEIKDDGHGMTLDIIKKAWMEPARDNKKGANGQRSRTKKFNRLSLGEKGVGRFSADKLGLRLEIVSRFCEFNPKTKAVAYLSPKEVVVVIEGKKFQDDAYLDEIECNWQTRTPKEFRQDDHGTLLRISELRTDWNRELVEKSHLGLARLSSPLSKAQDFEIFFNSNEFPQLSGKIENPLLENASYFLDGLIDEDGVMTYTLKRPEGTSDDKIDLRTGEERFHIRKGKDIVFRKPACGPFRFRLYAFERERKLWKKYEMDKEKRDLLNALCGVNIYRDNFRVLPYGEQGNDWLNFDRRRVLNPGKVLGNDRVIGYVEISQNSNPQLRDKTNREGLIEEGMAFADLRNLAIVAADFVGLQRHMDSPHKKRSKEKVEEAKSDIETGSQVVGQSSTTARATLENATKDIEEGHVEKAKTGIEQATAEIEVSKEATKRIDEGKRKLLEELMVSEEQIDNLISLSGIGMTAERMTHEFSRAVRLAEEQLQKSLGILNRERTQPKAVEHITSAISQLEIVRIGLQQMEPLYYSKRKYTEYLNVGEIARKMRNFYSNEINDLEIKVDVTGDEESELHVDMGKGHLMQVFNNLFDNSFYWLKFKPTEEHRRIMIKISEKDRTVIFADNGLGVDKKIEDHLFEPFISTKSEGRGLGLYIIHDILQNYKAEIELLTEEKLLEGANFKISFPEE